MPVQDGGSTHTIQVHRDCAAWAPLGADSHCVCLCSSLRFNPVTVLIARQIGWLQHIQNYTWYSPSIIHTLTQPYSANSTPSFLLAPPVTRAGHRGHQSTTHPHRGFAWSGAESMGCAVSVKSSRLEFQLRAGKNPILATERQSQSCLFRMCFVQPVFGLTRQGMGDGGRMVESRCKTVYLGWPVIWFLTWKAETGGVNIQEDRKEEVCGKVLCKFTNIQNKTAHLSNKKDYIFLSGKKLYTHDLNFFKF